MNLDSLLRECDPLREVSVPDPDVLVARSITNAMTPHRANVSRRIRAAARQRPIAAALSMAASLAVIVAISVTVLSSGSGLTAPVHTAWKAARPLPGQSRT